MPFSVSGYLPCLLLSRRCCQQPHDLSRITAPTLIANGDHDRMVPTSLSEDMHQRIPNSTLVIYPDAGHGGVFHRYQEFIPTLLAHLDA